MFVSQVKAALILLGLLARRYAGHSFRAGAATMATAAGIEDSLSNVILYIIPYTIDAVIQRNSRGM